VLKEFPGNNKENAGKEAIGLEGRILKFGTYVINRLGL
jgi:hypothetical protein